MGSNTPTIEAPLASEVDARERALLRDAEIREVKECLDWLREQVHQVRSRVDSTSISQSSES